MSFTLSATGFSIPIASPAATTASIAATCEGVGVDIHTPLRPGTCWRAEATFGKMGVW
jgi:hypothetical protein